MRLPKMKGHFWVVRDGEIVDADFPQHARLRRKYKCVPELNVYQPAPLKVEKAMVRLFERITLRAFQVDNWDDMMEEFMLVAKMTGNADNPTFNKCWTNCIIDIYYHGSGNIRFGSMGFKKKSDGDTVWYYGDDTLKDMADFLL